MPVYGLTSTNCNFKMCPSLRCSGYEMSLESRPEAAQASKGKKPRLGECQPGLLKESLTKVGLRDGKSWEDNPEGRRWERDFCRQRLWNSWTDAQIKTKF